MVCLGSRKCLIASDTWFRPRKHVRWKIVPPPSPKEVVIPNKIPAPAAHFRENVPGWCVCVRVRCDIYDMTTFCTNFYDPSNLTFGAKIFYKNWFFIIKYAVTLTCRSSTVFFFFVWAICSAGWLFMSSFLKDSLPHTASSLPSLITLLRSETGDYFSWRQRAKKIRKYIRWRTLSLRQWSRRRQKGLSRRSQKGEA